MSLSVKEKEVVFVVLCTIDGWGVCRAHSHIVGVRKNLEGAKQLEKEHEEDTMYHHPHYFCIEIEEVIIK